MANLRKDRLKVWFIDDLEEQLKKFENMHKNDFNVRCFSSRDDLLRVLDDGERPDALLCDIYLYPPGEAEQFEEEFRQKRRILEDLAKKWDAHAHEEGIDIIDTIKRKYNPSFAMFAYTAKAPYLMASEGFERLMDLNVRVLLKDRIGQEAERTVIEEGVERARTERGWRRIVAKYLKLSIVISAMFGVIMESILGRVFNGLGGVFNGIFF